MSELEPERVRAAVTRWVRRSVSLLRRDRLDAGCAAPSGEHPTGPSPWPSTRRPAGAARAEAGTTRPRRRSSSRCCYARPRRPPLPQLSLVAGLAVATALEQAGGVPMLLKWPNDVLSDGRKVAGILLEATGGSVACGIGINVNQDERDLPAMTRVPATSLRLARGPHLRPRRRARRRVERARGTDTRRGSTGGLAALAVELEARNALRGSRVRADGRARHGRRDRARRPAHGRARPGRPGARGERRGRMGLTGELDAWLQPGVTRATSAAHSSGVLAFDAESSRGSAASSSESVISSHSPIWRTELERGISRSP